MEMLQLAAVTIKWCKPRHFADRLIFLLN